MAQIDDITNAIDSFFQNYTAISIYTDVSSDGNKYELYIYSLTHLALSINHRLRLRTQFRNEFNFKCSPGPINDDYSYYTFTSQNKFPLELRNGIEINGHNIEHEMDICVLNMMDSGYADRPKASALKMALECKFYSNPNSLKGEVRKFLGAISDLSKNGIISSNGFPSGCIHLEYNFHKSFVTNVASSLRPDLQRFLETYSLCPRFGVLPRSLEEAQLLSEIQNESLGW